MVCPKMGGRMWEYAPSSDVSKLPDIAEIIF